MGVHSLDTYQSSLGAQFLSLCLLTTTHEEDVAMRDMECICVSYFSTRLAEADHNATYFSRGHCTEMNLLLPYAAFSSFLVCFPT